MFDLKIPIVLLIAIVLSACSLNTRMNNGKKEQIGVVDSIIISNIKSYKEQVAKKGIIEVEFYKRSKGELCFLLSFIINESEMENISSKYYIYIDGMPVLFDDSNAKRVINNTPYSTIDSSFIKRVSPLLHPNDESYILCHVKYRIVFYKDKKVSIKETCMPTPDFFDILPPKEEKNN